MGFFDAFETNTVTITPRTPSTETGGGTGWTNGTPITSVLCSIQMPKASRVEAHAREGQVCARTIFFFSDASLASVAGIKTGWLITPTVDTAKYYVLSVAIEQDGGFGRSYAVDVEERS
jgi:hypothetical protein